MNTSLNDDALISTLYFNPQTQFNYRTIKIYNNTTLLLKKHRINRIEVVLMYLNDVQYKNNIVFFQHEGKWGKTNVVREHFKEIYKKGITSRSVQLMH